MTTDFLHPRFQTATRFKDTRRNHQFIHTENSLIMTPVSRGSLTIPKIVVMTMIGILAMPTLCLLNMVMST